MRQPDNNGLYIYTCLRLAAIARYREKHPEPLDINIRIHPFQLNNMLTDEPEKREEWGVRKFGAERFAAVRQCLNDKFATVGLPEM